MPIQDYSYSIQDDFVINHKVDITILQLEVEDSSIITTQLHHIYANLEDDECQVWFFDVLSEAEETELDAIIAAHTGEYVGGLDSGDAGEVSEGGGKSGINIFFGDHSDNSWFVINMKPWGTINRFIFEGTNALGVPVGVKALIKSKDVDPERTSGLRLYDVTNSNVIFSWEWFHTDGWKICAENVTNFPSGEAIFELQGAKEEGECYISNFMIVFSGTIVDNMS